MTTNNNKTIATPAEMAVMTHEAVVANIRQALRVPCWADSNCVDVVWHSMWDTILGMWGNPDEDTLSYDTCDMVGEILADMIREEIGEDPAELM